MLFIEFGSNQGLNSIKGVFDLFFQTVDMEQVDFAFIDHEGVTFYRRCFELYLRVCFVWKRPEADWTKLLTKVEQVFDLLVTEGNKNGFNVNSILEVPDSGGSTCFSIASGCSEKICHFIIEKGVEVRVST